MVSSDSRNDIHDTGEHHTKRTRLSEDNITDECVEENANSLYCSVEVKAEMNGTSLNLQILIVIRIVILNHKVNKL